MTIFDQKTYLKKLNPNPDVYKKKCVAVQLEVIYSIMDIIENAN
jgi:hypothetical protein